jgi:F-type H+-transporting ATPase subunit b
MEIVEHFGINWVLLSAQIVNFLIIFYILKRFAYKPILALLKNRELTIKKGLDDAEEARKLLEQATEKERDMLKKAQSETRKLLEEAKKERAEVLKNAEVHAKQQADAILKEAKEQIAFETQEAEKRLSSHVSQLAIQFLEKSLSELFTTEDQEKIMDRAIRKMKEKVN